MAEEISSQPRWLIAYTAIVVGSLIVSASLVIGKHWLALPVFWLSLILFVGLRIVAVIRLRLALERNFPDEEVRDLHWDVLPLLLRKRRR
ncbi:MAG: hypothetical protein HYT83_02475 [Candidatus Levybacteria bacterium]|nr:hypothetical protein [Candidatus Levybacteria bacterium]